MDNTEKMTPKDFAEALQSADGYDMLYARGLLFLASEMVSTSLATEHAGMPPHVAHLYHSSGKGFTYNLAAYIRDKKGVSFAEATEILSGHLDQMIELIVETYREGLDEFKRNMRVMIPPTGRMDA